MEAVKMKAKTGAELLLEAQEQLEKEYGERPTIEANFHNIRQKKTATKVAVSMNQFLHGEGVRFGNHGDARWVTAESAEFNPKVKAVVFYD